MNKYVYAIYCGIVAVLLFSCNKEKEVAVTSVSLSQPTAEMIVGETVKLTATVLPGDATDKSVLWASSKQSVATITNSGLVTAVSEGTSTITASAGGKSATCLITVSKGRVAVSGIIISETTITLIKGESKTLTATVIPSDATDKTVTWTSSDTSIAEVDQSGKIIAKKGGVATISAKAENQTAQCSVTVNVPVTKISLDKETLVLEEESSAILFATIEPEDATEINIVWRSSDDTIVTVSQEGNVTAIKAGIATVTAEAGGKQASCEITVNKKVIAVSSVTLNKTKLSLFKGSDETLVATVTPNNATNKSVTWSSSDNNIASVDQNGKVTAVSGGEATITAKAGEKEATCTVTVTVPVESVSLDKSSITLEEEQTASLIATVLPEDATDKTVAWYSSNDSVAKVENGFITAVKEGSATIIAKVGEIEAICEITVEINSKNKKIQFADAKAKEKLVAAFDTNHDGELSYGEAAAVTSINGVFGDETSIVSFEEFQYFTAVKDIPDKMFNGWTTLQKINLPNSIEIIGNYSFHRCYSLKSLSIPDSVRQIGAYAFGYCRDLEEISIPEGVTDVYEGTFIACTSLKNVSLPESLTSMGKWLGDGVFSGCSSLTQIVLPSNLKTIGANCFLGSKVKSITIPESVLTIGMFAFKNCSSLSSVIFQGEKTSIGREAFYGCGIKSVALPKQMKIIPEMAFYNCTSLIEVIFPPTLESIEYMAFRGCRLQEIDLPSSVVSIAGEAFYNNNLEKITIRANVPPEITSDSFAVKGNYRYPYLIYVPESSIDEYCNARIWNTYKDRIHAIP